MYSSLFVVVSFVFCVCRCRYRSGAIAMFRDYFVNATGKGVPDAGRELIEELRVSSVRASAAMALSGSPVLRNLAKIFINKSTKY
jgi:hypothetical protein